MMKTSIRTRRSWFARLALCLTVLAVAAPAASGMPLEGPHSPPAIDQPETTQVTYGNRGGRFGVPLQVNRTSTPSDIDWSDAGLGIGIGVALGLAIAGGLGVLAVSRKSNRLADA
jgi:hypothetical protein